MLFLHPNFNYTAPLPFDMGTRGQTFRKSASWFVAATEQKNYYRAKRALDITLSLIALIIAIPILVLCAVAIKIDSRGPVFFVQLRTGKGGRRFKMYKLRTMVCDAEKLKERYRHMSKLTYPDFKISRDPRVTRIGRFLRKTSFDELPQLFNVLKGDMSLVGPRPTSFAATTYRLWQTERLEALPGLTGLWQVTGRDNIDFDERARLDILYTRNQSLWLDLKIILKTFGAVLRGKGAH